MTPPGNGCPDEEVERLREQGLREIPPALGQRRHVGDPCHAFAQMRALVVGEEERAIAHHGTADRAAELVAAVVGGRLVFRREVIARAERAVAEELVRRPRDRVRSRLRDHVDLAAGVPAERRVVRRRVHLELADRIDRRPHSRRVQLRIDVVHAVEQEPVEVLPGAVHRQREVAAARARRALGRRDGARGEQRQLEEVPAVERQPGHLPVVDEGVQLRRVAVHRHERRGHVHRLQDVADLQRHAQPEFLVHRQLGARHERPEPALAHVDAVGARRQLGDGEAAPLVGPRDPLVVRRFARHAHLDVCERRQRRIHDVPSDGRAVLLSRERPRRDEADEKDGRERSEEWLHMDGFDAGSDDIDRPGGNHGQQGSLNDTWTETPAFARPRFSALRRASP